MAAPENPFALIGGGPYPFAWIGGGPYPIA